MRAPSYRRERRREVLAGLMIILVTFSYLTSLLLDFNFVSPYATLQEDLSYLSNHIENQQISTWSWLASSLITFLSIPVFLMLFHKKLRVLQYVNGAWLLGASAGFLMMGIAGMELSKELATGLLTGTPETDEQAWIRLLGLYQKELDYRYIGSSFLGLFAFGLGLSKFWMKQFPVVAAILLIICGPTMIFFNWYDPDHLLRTVAMAGLLIGVCIFSVRVINKGL
jgi:hypothetical protein